ncbi:MAG: metallophosphoesterase [Burkholderiales bacterium]|nr:metallophosphoesterase [Burkholderiales bacterium]
MTRIVQISDTHLSPGKRHFAANWSPLRQWILAQEPDLIVHTGDVTVDGADVDADFAYCAGLLASLGVPVHAVPGNHDVGEPQHAYQPTSSDRVARWRRHFGGDYWSIDIEGWRLIGLDSMLFGADIPEEREQLAWLDATLRDADGRRIAWFMHKPLFLENPDEGDTGYWTVKPAPRADILERVRRHGIAVIATGHLHKMHDRILDGCRYLWAPSSGFVVGERLQEPMPGYKKLGAVVYELAGDTLTVRMDELPELTRYWIDDVVHEVYPPRGGA